MKARDCFGGLGMTIERPIGIFGLGDLVSMFLSKGQNFSPKKVEQSLDRMRRRRKKRSGLKSIQMKAQYEVTRVWRKWLIKSVELIQVCRDQEIDQFPLIYWPIVCLSIFMFISDCLASKDLIEKDNNWIHTHTHTCNEVKNRLENETVISGDRSSNANNSKKKEVENSLGSNWTESDQSFRWWPVLLRFCV